MGVTLEALRQINESLLDHRWTREDLEELIAPGAGVVSSFETLRNNLTLILKKDLGDTPLVVGDLRECR